MAKSKKNIISSPVSSLKEGVDKLQAECKKNQRKFDESVDVAIKLGIDPKQSNQSVKGSVVLPSGSGKQVKIIVFTADENVKKLAIDLGASLAGLEDLVAKIEDGFLDFDCCIATPDVMQKISKVAKKLGPRGLMPSPKNGTVTTDVEKAIKDSLKGKVNFKNDKTGIIHCSVGKVSFKIEDLISNINSVVKMIKDIKPEGVKGKYIRDFYINSTMGSAIKIDLESLN